ncbi:MAG: hypothetical protein WD294_08840 [Phycisphaeraceae bacterium]
MKTLSASSPPHPPQWLVVVSIPYMALWGAVSVGFLAIAITEARIPQGWTGWGGAAIFVAGPWVHAYGLWGRSIACSGLSLIPHAALAMVTAVAGIGPPFEPVNLLLLGWAGLQATLFVSMAWWTHRLFRNFIA